MRVKINKNLLARKSIILGKFFGVILVAVLPALVVFVGLQVKQEREKAFLFREIEKLREEKVKTEAELPPLFSVTPLASPSPTIILFPTKAELSPKKFPYKFNNTQYEVWVSNLDYRGTVVHFDLHLKNLSIVPFLTQYQIASDCKVVKNGVSTKYGTSGHTEILPKGLLSGESFQARLALTIHGTDYDELGNKIPPSGDLRIQTCKINLWNKDGVGESKIIQFPN